MSNKATCDKCGAIGKPSMNWTSMTTNICVDCQQENARDMPFYTTEQVEPLLARITFLEAQIEMLKCCENCKHAGNTLWDDYSEPCNDCSRDALKWEARKC